MLSREEKEKYEYIIKQLIGATEELKEDNDKGVE